MAAELNPLAGKTAPDQAAQDAKAEALGTAGTAATAAYDATLPADGGSAEPVKQPADVERFVGLTTLGAIPTVPER